MTWLSMIIVASGSIRRYLLLAWLLPGLLLVSLGASDPEIVKVRVPASKVASWFPVGSDLQVLPPEKFDAMIQAIRDRPAARPVARLLKAEHSARWESGILVGRSSLTIRPGAEPGPSLILVDPWSPALMIGQGVGSEWLRATADGRLAVQVAANGPDRVEPQWRLRARTGSDGRAFALALPDLEISSLVLDLPDGLVPEASAGPRIGPEPGATPDRATWRFEAARGRIDLKLRDSSVKGNKPRPSDYQPMLWLEGPTRIDLSASPANWRADWTLDESPGCPRTLAIDLDPGLEIIDVLGPRVASFRVETVALASRLVIKLDGEGSGSSTMTIRAICQPPVEGVWPVPSARPVPLEAIWTGGRTSVRLDDSRVLQRCEERSGRRVTPNSAESIDPPSLVFEPNGLSGPVADLTFRKPSADATVDVRGHLRLGEEVPRIEVALTWTVERGRMISRSVDLPPGWTPDRVLGPSGQQVPWHADRLANGVTRVQIILGSPDDEARSITLTLGASALQAGVTGPLALPRVRPSPGPRVIDEVWVATPDSRITIRPTLGRGIAWLDPPDPPLDDIPTPWVAEDMRHALAWRWLTDGAEAGIVRAPPRDHPRGEVKVEATIASGRVRFDWALTVDSQATDLRAIPIHLDEVLEAPIRWRLRTAGGPTVEVRPLDDAGRAEQGFPTTGSAFVLELVGPSLARIQLEGRMERAWPGSGHVPVLMLPERFLTRGLVAVAVEDSTHAKFIASGLTPIEPDGTDPEVMTRLENPAGPRGLRTRRAAMYGYRASGGRLQVETTRGSVEASGGFVSEANLVSQVFPGAGARHRLTLQFATDTARTIELTMPPGCSVDRLRRDGQPIVPSTTQTGSFQVEIPEPGPSRSTCTLTIDYRSADAADPGLLPIAPSRLLPKCSMPCLSFVWEILAPEPWSLGERTSGLVETDPRPVPSMAAKILGFHWSPWGRPDRGPSPKIRDAMLADLDKTASELGEPPTTLGDWLLKLDAGRWPIVVDRLALRSTGWGPGSRIINRATPEGRPTGSVRSILEPLGLVAVARDGLILITNRDELSVQSGWSSNLQVVPGNGSDATDRFQSADRWWRETTPRGSSEAGLFNRSTGQGGWTTWRLVATGWPVEAASVRLVDPRLDAVRGWLIALAVLTVGLVARHRSATFRATGLALIIAAAGLGMAATWPNPSMAWSGLVRGALGSLAVWAGRALRNRGNDASPLATEAAPSTRRRILGGVGVASLIVLGLGLGSPGKLAIGQADRPILVLLPFDGLPDPMAKPDRVVLLLSDFERLQRLARPEAPARLSTAVIQSSHHQVTREGPGLAGLESRYKVEVIGDQPVSWTMPVGLALDLSATVDDRPAALAITPDGRSATLTLDGPGVHKLWFRRSLRLSTTDRGKVRLVVPINPAAFARLKVVRDPGTAGVEVASALGSLETTPEAVEVGLGPMALLDIRWSLEDRSASTTIQGSVEANILWDARPVGDLFRLKLSHNDPDGASTIRVALEPGLMVRRYAIPDVVGVRIEGTPEQPEWVVQVDPPLPKDQPIEVDLWRPAAPGTEVRRWPSIGFAATGRSSSLLGFRRSVGWSGRLEPRAGMEAVADTVFTKGWGSLPVDGMILAGAVRVIGPATPLEVATRPLSLRRTIRPKVQVDLVPGRLNLLVEGVLTDRQGRSFELEVGLPNDLRVTRVEADGLIDWQKVGRDKLRLQFDGSELPERSIRVEGHLPVPADSEMTESRSYLASIPWPRWLDVETGPGILVIASQTRVSYEPGEGVTLLPSVGPVEPDAPIRSSYQVDRPSGLTMVKWSSPSAKVVVSVQSDLTIDPGGLTWTSAVVCDINGGPADALHWSLPTDWANAATLEIEGIEHRLVAELKGAKGEQTEWTILPASPIWGRARLVLRAKRPFPPGVPFRYPELSPLALAGRGSVERYDLAIANVSGQPMEVAGSTGLQPIDVARFRGTESSSPPGSIDRAYHVTGERWWLRMRVGRSADDPQAARVQGQAQVALAHVRCSIREDGTVVGRARYDLEPRPGPFLTVRLPEPAAILWSSVDGVIGTSHRDGPGGRWLIPLGDHQARRVLLAWSSPSSGLTSGENQGLVFPTLDQIQVPTMLSVTAAESVEVVAEPGVAESLDLSRWVEETAEQIAGKVVTALADLDRSSRRDRALVLDDLIEVELKNRDRSRNPAGARSSPEPATNRIRAAIASIDEASENSGLDDLTQEARSRIGVAPGFPPSNETPRETTALPIRIRQIGITSFYQVKPGDSTRKAPIVWSRNPRNTRSADPWLIAAIGLLVAATIGFWAARPWYPRHWAVQVLFGFLVVGLSLWEPLGMGGLLGLVGLGRKRWTSSSG